MKLNLNKVKLTPKNLNFGFCVYGEPIQEIIDWCDYWNFKLETSGKYTNVILTDSINILDIFEDTKVYEYGDFFSPNLNKHLHLGHLSNLIIAKTLQSLGIAKNTIAILGDTLDGAVDKHDALVKYNEYCNQFGYNVNEIFFASEQEITGIEYRSDMLGKIFGEGEGDYVGTKIFDISDDIKIVGIKSDGSTSYFYQDVALAVKLGKPTLYVTGSEQNPHFANLKLLFPDINHIGLGLVTTDGKKQSSSMGNVIFMEDILTLVKEKFNNDSELTWNVLAGHILKYDLPSTKDINLAQIDNVKTSHGLYLSYTLARLKSAGMSPKRIKNFNSLPLQYKLLRTKTFITPNILFEELIELCRVINQLYITKHIKDNEENQIMFQPMLDDLLHGMELLGLFNIDKV
jgi:hypothetical protein